MNQNDKDPYFSDLFSVEFTSKDIAKRKKVPIFLNTELIERILKLINIV
jgi:hypothetical protein